MPKLIQPVARPTYRLNDSRSTGAARTPRPADLLALRGTLKNRP